MRPGGRKKWDAEINDPCICETSATRGVSPSGWLWLLRDRAELEKVGEVVYVGRAVHQAVEEGRVGVLIALLDAAGELIGRLGPVVILHRDHEHCFDLLRVRGKSARCCEQDTHSQRKEKSGVRHESIQGRNCAVSCGDLGRLVRFESRTLRLPRDSS